MRVLVFALSLCFFIGCASSGPKPWEKGNLSKKQMQLSGYDTLQAAVDEHVFSSKEGSFGGNGVGGGGCGCN